VTIHEVLGMVATEMARRLPHQSDVRTIYAAGFRLGLEIGLRQPHLGRALGDRLRDEIAANSLRPRDTLDEEMADRVDTFAKILRGDG
jgi:hypothetical protein